MQQTQPAAKTTVQIKIAWSANKLQFALIANLATIWIPLVCHAQILPPTVHSVKKEFVEHALPDSYLNDIFHFSSVLANTKCVSCTLENCYECLDQATCRTCLNGKIYAHSQLQIKVFFWSQGNATTPYLGVLSWIHKE
jgi:hypothetical protein